MQYTWFNIFLFQNMKINQSSSNINLERKRFDPETAYLLT